MGFMDNTDDRLRENIAAVAFGIALERGTDGATFVERHSDGLEGQLGCIRWLIEAGEQFDRAEVALRASVPRFDWYLAIDAFVREIMQYEDDLPSLDELFKLAGRCIKVNAEAEMSTNDNETTR